MKTSLDLLTLRSVPEQEGVTVVDKSSGRVMVGGAAPKRSELFEWLQSHRSYQIHLPSRRASSSSKEKMVDGERLNLAMFLAFVSIPSCKKKIID